MKHYIIKIPGDRYCTTHNKKKHITTATLVTTNNNIFFMSIYDAMYYIIKGMNVKLQYADKVFNTGFPMS